MLMCSRYVLSFMCVCLWAFSAKGWTDSTLLDAIEAYKRKDSNQLYALTQTMKDDQFAMYPAYFALDLNWEQSTPQDIQAFAERYSNNVLTEKIAADYVERNILKGNLQNAQAVARYVRNPDNNEQCALAIAQSATDQYSLLQQLKPAIWLKNDDISALCKLAANTMMGLVPMSQADYIQRLWTMLAGDRLIDAQRVAANLNLSLSVAQLRDAGSNPGSFLQTPPSNTFEAQALFIYAIKKQAEKDTSVAAAYIEHYKDQLPNTSYRYGYRLLALQRLSTIGSQGFDQQILEWFRLSIGAPFSSSEAEAYARQAIRFSAWNDVFIALEYMNTSQQDERVWKYWFARAAEQQSDAETRALARQFYQLLAQEDDYYGLLSRAKLGVAVRLPKSVEPSKADHKRLAENAHFARAFTLRRMDVDSGYYNREWNWAVRLAVLKQDDDLLLAAAAAAIDMQWYDRAIYAMEQTRVKHNLSYQYPTPFLDITRPYSQQYDVDLAWIYGLTRQESRFATSARSDVGANGLMQLMPATARWMAGKLGENYRSDLLHDAKTNIRYGSFYLSEIYKELDSNMVLVTAGYNAGPSRARRWQPENIPLDADQYTETIPFLETRDYVKNVMSNAVHYAILFESSKQSIAERMTAIPIRDSRAIAIP